MTSFAYEIWKLCYESERFPAPELLPNDRGGHDYDWWRAPRQTLSVIAHDGQLHWAWLIGEESGHGNDPDTGMPPRVLSALEKLYPLRQYPFGEPDGR